MPAIRFGAIKRLVRWRSQHTFALVGSLVFGPPPPRWRPIEEGGMGSEFPGWLEIPLGYGNFGIGAGTVGGRAAIAIIPRQADMPAGKPGDPFVRHADVEGMPLPGTVLVSFKDARSARELAALCEASARHIEKTASTPATVAADRGGRDGE